MELCCIVTKHFKEHRDGTISLDPLCRATLRQVNVPYGKYLDFTLGRLGRDKSITISGAKSIWCQSWNFEPCPEMFDSPETFDEWVVNATLKTGLVPDFERCTLTSINTAFGSGYRTLIEKDLRTGEITYEIPDFEGYFSRIDEAERRYAQLK